VAWGQEGERRQIGERRQEDEGGWGTKGGGRPSWLW